MATPMSTRTVATNHELTGGDQGITVQQDAILTVVDSADDVVTTTVAEFQTFGATAPAPALPEMFTHLYGLPARVDVVFDVYDAMPIIYDVGVQLRSEMSHAAGRHELDSLPTSTWEMRGQSGALDLGYNLGTHDPTDIQANLIAGLLPGRRDIVIRGDLSSGAHVEDVGVFSIPLSREYRSVDVDLGWGIVVGGMSRDDFNEILSFPHCFE